MTILEKLHWIENNSCIYNIHYCKAGVGFMFYEGDLPVLSYDDTWRQHLYVHRYYDTFVNAVRAEYKRLKLERMGKFGN